MAKAEKLHNQYIVQGQSPEVVQRFDVVELNPAAAAVANSPEYIALQGRAKQVSELVTASWTRKFATGPDALMTEEQVANFCGSPEDQFAKIASGKARYLMALSLEDSPSKQVLAVARVESYNPFSARMLGRDARYPNVTDLETRDGLGKGSRCRAAAAALLHHAIRDYDPGRKIAAYSEVPSTDEVAFFEEFGFAQRQEVKDPNLPFAYVHLESPELGMTEEYLHDQYKFLQQPGIIHEE